MKELLISLCTHLFFLSFVLLSFFLPSGFFVLFACFFVLFFFSDSHWVIYKNNLKNPKFCKKSIYIVYLTPCACLLQGQLSLHSCVGSSSYQRYPAFPGPVHHRVLCVSFLLLVRCQGAQGDDVSQWDFCGNAKEQVSQNKAYNRGQSHSVLIGQLLIQTSNLI